MSPAAIRRSDRPERHICRACREHRDLSTAEAARTTALRARLREWRTSVGAKENTPNPAVDMEMFKRIYVDFDPTRFNPLHPDDAAWRAVGKWRQQMDAAIKRAGHLRN